MAFDRPSHLALVRTLQYTTSSVGKRPTTIWLGYRQLGRLDKLDKEEKVGFWPMIRQAYAVNRIVSNITTLMQEFTDLPRFELRKTAVFRLVPTGQINGTKQPH